MTVGNEQNDSLFKREMHMHNINVYVNGYVYVCTYIPQKLPVYT